MNKKNIEGFAGLDSWPKCRDCDDVKDKYESGFNIAKSLEADCTKYLNLAEQLLNDKIVDNNKRFIEVDNNIKFNNYFVLKIDSKLFDSIISSTFVSGVSKFLIIILFVLFLLNSTKPIL